MGMVKGEGGGGLEKVRKKSAFLCPLLGLGLLKTGGVGASRIGYLKIGKRGCEERQAEMDKEG